MISYDIITKIIYGIFSAIWLSFFYHYSELLSFYFANFDYWNDIKVMHLTFILETWQLISLIMLTWCVFKLIDRR